MNKLLLIVLMCLSSSAFAFDMSEIEKTAAELHGLVSQYETGNYYNSAGVHVITNENLKKITLAPLSNDNMPFTFLKCLYNQKQETYDRFRNRVESLLAGYGKLEWLTDSKDLANDPSVWSYNDHQGFEDVEKVFSEADEYGGPGGYYPQCSVAVKTESGLSFLFHAIDTY